MIAGELIGPRQTLEGSIPGLFHYGIQGPPGKSAYKYAVEGGFKGTEKEFMELLANVDLAGYATEQWVKDQKYLDKVPEGYATEKFVKEGYQPKGEYLTKVPEGYAKTSEIPTKPEDIGAQPAGNYLTNVPEGYATEDFVRQYHRENLPQFDETANGSVITLSDSSDMALLGLKIFGKTTQNGTAIPEAPVPLESVGDGGSLTITIGVSETDSNPQTLTVQKPANVPVFLPGIPVIKGGNYTDENGQQWICDEVDFEKGIYTQRIVKKVLTGTESTIHKYGANSICYFFEFSQSTKGYGMSYSTHFKNNKKGDAFATGQTEIGIISDHPDLGRKYVTWGIVANTVDDFRAFLSSEYAKGTPVTVYAVAATPIEHALSEVELAQYAALHTNYPNTTIYNDVGADMEVQYVADTKLYIDENFAEIADLIMDMEDKPGGKDGATFTPFVDDDGNLSWSNDKGLDNPKTVNIKGEKPKKGTDYYTEAEKTEMVNAVLSALPTWNGGSY